MSMSLTAEVFWGFNLGYTDDIDDEQMPDWWRSDADWDEVLAQLHGWRHQPYPIHLMPEGMRDSRKSSAERDELRRQFHATPEFQAWSYSRDHLNERARGFSVEISRYGYQLNSKAVRVRASVQSNDWEAEPIKPLVVAPEWPDQITEFCTLLELPIPPDGPQWHLCATYA